MSMSFTSLRFGVFARRFQFRNRDVKCRRSNIFPIRARESDFNVAVTCIFGTPHGACIFGSSRGRQQRPPDWNRLAARVFIRELDVSQDLRTFGPSNSKCPFTNSWRADDGGEPAHASLP